jgi:hypothetical protein
MKEELARLKTERRAAPPPASNSADAAFLTDVFDNIKDGFEAQLGCSICTEVTL